MFCPEKIIPDKFAPHTSLGRTLNLLRVHPASLLRDNRGIMEADRLQRLIYMTKDRRHVAQSDGPVHDGFATDLAYAVVQMNWTNGDRLEGKIKKILERAITSDIKQSSA